MTTPVPGNRTRQWPFGPMARCVRRFRDDLSGSTAIEYTLIAGLVFLAVVGALRLYAERMTAMYNYIGATISKSG